MAHFVGLRNTLVIIRKKICNLSSGDNNLEDYTPSSGYNCAIRVILHDLKNKPINIENDSEKIKSDWFPHQNLRAKL